MHLLPQLWVIVSCDDRGTSAMGLRVGAGGLPAAQFAICTSMFSINVFWRRANAIIVWNDHVSLFQSTPVGWHVFVNICRQGINFFFCPRPHVDYEKRVGTSASTSAPDQYWDLVARAMISAGFVSIPFDYRRLALSIYGLVPRNGVRAPGSPVNTVRSGIGYLDDLKVETFNPDQTQWPEWNSQRLPAVPLAFDETWVQQARTDLLRKMAAPLTDALVINGKQEVLLTREGALRAEAELRCFVAELPAAQTFDSANPPSDRVTREIARCFGTLGPAVVPYAVDLFKQRGIKVTGEARPVLEHPTSSRTFWATAGDEEVEAWRAGEPLCAISAEIDVVYPPPDFATHEFHRVPQRDGKVLRHGSSPDDFLRSLVASGHGEALADLGHDLEQLRPAPRREAVPEAVRAAAEAVGAKQRALKAATSTAVVAAQPKCPVCGRQRNGCPTFGPACTRFDELTEEDEAEEEQVISDVQRCLKGQGFKKQLQKQIARRARIEDTRFSKLINRKLSVRTAPNLVLPSRQVSHHECSCNRCVDTEGASSQSSTSTPVLIGLNS